jgi:prolyl-tRNA synthetase
MHTVHITVVVRICINSCHFANPNCTATLPLETHQLYMVQNFARAFDVFFQTKEETRELVWATSWGVSTRLMGALVMTHADDAGLRYIHVVL